MTLLALLKERIDAQGPISIAEYMALALAHPEYGYYMRKDPLGVQGDFTTAPEISQLFGEMIGAWLAMQWIMMGKPKAALAEIGPGRGTMMADLLRATAHIPGFHDAVTIHLMELSPPLRRIQWDTLEGRHPEIRWHTGFGEIAPDKPLLLVANEFFDALPIRQFRHSPSGWEERLVGLGGQGELAFTFAPQPPPALLKDAPVSKKLYEYSEAAIQMALVMSNRIFTRGGSALIIDYGYGGNQHGDTLQAVRAHQYHDPLADPGGADLTAHVDFFSLTRAAATGGATVHGPAGQGEFLKALGAQARLEALCRNATAAQKASLMSGYDRLTSPRQMGELFKALALVHPALPKPEGF